MKKVLLSAAIISAFLFSLPYSASADEISFFELLFQESDTGGLEPGAPPAPDDLGLGGADSRQKSASADSLGRAFRWKFDGIGQLRLTSVENDKFLRQSRETLCLYPQGMHLLSPPQYPLPALSAVLSQTRELMRLHSYGV